MTIRLLDPILLLLLLLLRLMLLLHPLLIDGGA
jgi:hypothetical protein